MCQLSAKNLFWNFLWNVSKFDWIFYLMPVLHKKFSQSLWLSPRNSFAWRFLKIGSVIVYSFVRNYPNLQVYRLTHVHSTALTIKAVYEVSNSWYGLTFDSVCISYKNFVLFVWPATLYWQKNLNAMYFISHTNQICTQL